MTNNEQDVLKYAALSNQLTAAAKLLEPVKERLKAWVKGFADPSAGREVDGAVKVYAQVTKPKSIPDVGTVGIQLRALVSGGQITNAVIAGLFESGAVTISDTVGVVDAIKTAIPGYVAPSKQSCTPAEALESDSLRFHILP